MANLLKHDLDTTEVGVHILVKIPQNHWLVFWIGERQSVRWVWRVRRLCRGWVWPAGWAHISDASTFSGVLLPSSEKFGAQEGLWKVHIDSQLPHPVLTHSSHLLYVMPTAQVSHFLQLQRSYRYLSQSIYYEMYVYRKISIKPGPGLFFRLENPIPVY